MSSLCPPVGFDSLFAFTKQTVFIQSEFGALRGVCFYAADGTFLTRFDNFDSPREGLLDVLRRAILEISVRTPVPQAFYVGLFATDQRDPSGGYVSAELTMELLDELLHPAGLQLLHWVESWGEEVRIPDALARRHAEAAA